MQTRTYVYPTILYALGGYGHHAEMVRQKSSKKATTHDIGRTTMAALQYPSALAQISKEYGTQLSKVKAAPWSLRK
jgi:hypothetical protein